MTDFFPDDMWRIDHDAVNEWLRATESHEPPSPGVVTPETLSELDFEPLCEKCPETAKHYIRFHPAGRCTHPIFQGEMPQQLLVCDLHLDEYTRRADLIYKALNPQRWWRFLREDLPGKCATCGKVIQLPTDVLEFVRAL